LTIEQRNGKEKEEEEKITAYLKEKADKEAEIAAEQKYFAKYIDELKSKNKDKFKS